MDHVQAKTLLDERVHQAPQSERVQKVIGAIAVMLALGALLAIPFLPSTPNTSAYEVCGAEGISRETVNQARTAMRNSTATREEKLAVFLTNFKTPRNEGGIQTCGRAILRESEKGK